MKNLLLLAIGLLMFTSCSSDDSVGDCDCKTTPAGTLEFLSSDAIRIGCPDELGDYAYVSDNEVNREIHCN